MKIKLFPKVNTYAGFPVGDPGNKDSKGPQRGIAIILTLFMITLMMIFMADMQVNAVVESELAVANRDNLKAEYLAKSGGNLANLLLSTDLALDLTMAENPALAGMAGGAAGGQGGGATDGPGDIWGQLNGLPIGGSTAELLEQMQESFDLSKVGDSKVIDMLKQLDGHFIINVVDETARMNINYCAIRTTEPLCKKALKLLMSCPAEREYMERKKLNPSEIVGALGDWVDSNTEPDPDSGYGSEQDPYSRREPKVTVKNSFFESLDELRVIEGWDADMHKIFSPYLTVYPMPLDVAVSNRSSFFVNYNSASREFLNCIFPKAATECNEKSAMFMQNRQDMGVASDATAINNSLRENFCAEDEMTKIFTYRSDVYRITVTGESGVQRKTIEYVLARQKPDDTDQKNQYKSAIKYLYWKML